MNRDPEGFLGLVTSQEILELMVMEGQGGALSGKSRPSGAESLPGGTSLRIDREACESEEPASSAC